MRIAIASRIFDPEPSAASFRLGALASALQDAGHEVTVLTVRVPGGIELGDSLRNYDVKRFPVLRDKNGYVRGYLQYLDFDVPLFFRLLFSRRFDFIISEPPPTTGFFVRIVAGIRRIPYAYYAADIWSDASSQTNAPGWMVRAVRGIEKFALRGARLILSVSDGVTSRLSEFGISDSVVTVGNGIRAELFSLALQRTLEQEIPKPEHIQFVYAGTASEWHGAGVFVRALPQVIEKYPGARLVFVGSGAERQQIEDDAKRLGVFDSIDFEPTRSPEKLAPLLRSASAAIASVKPGAGYDFAFPTKLYSAAVCGAPLIYSGVGPGADFVLTKVAGHALGWAVGSSADDVAQAMLLAAETPFTLSRRLEVATWAEEHVSLTKVGERAVTAIEQSIAQN